MSVLVSLLILIIPLALRYHHTKLMVEEKLADSKSLYKKRWYWTGISSKVKPSA
jgi:hypothetical protein